MGQSGAMTPGLEGNVMTAKQDRNLQFGVEIASEASGVPPRLKDLLLDAVTRLLEVEGEIAISDAFADEELHALLESIRAADSELTTTRERIASSSHADLESLVGLSRTMQELIDRAREAMLDARTRLREKGIDVHEEVVQPSDFANRVEEMLSVPESGHAKVVLNISWTPHRPMEETTKADETENAVSQTSQATHAQNESEEVPQPHVEQMLESELDQADGDSRSIDDLDSLDEPISSRGLISTVVPRRRSQHQEQEEARVVESTRVHTFDPDLVCRNLIADLNDGAQTTEAICVAIQEFFSRIPDDAQAATMYLDELLRTGCGPALGLSAISSLTARFGVVALRPALAERMLEDLVLTSQHAIAAALVLSGPEVQWPEHLSPSLILALRDFDNLPQSLAQLSDALTRISDDPSSSEKSRLALGLMSVPVTLRYCEEVEWQSCHALLSGGMKIGRWTMISSLVAEVHSYYQQTVQAYPERSVMESLATESPFAQVAQLKEELRRLYEQLPNRRWRGVPICEKTWRLLMRNDGPVWHTARRLLSEDGLSTPLDECEEWARCFDPDEELRRAQTKVLESGSACSSRVQGAFKKNMIDDLRTVANVTLQIVEAERRWSTRKDTDLTRALALRKAAVGMWSKVLKECQSIASEMPWLQNTVSSFERQTSEILNLKEEELQK